MEVGDEVVDLTGLDEELKRSGDSSASGREGKKSHKILCTPDDEETQV